MVDLTDVVERLRSIDEELSDASMSILSEALQSEPDPTELAREKRITRARRSIEKAVVLLESNGSRSVAE